MSAASTITEPGVYTLSPEVYHADPVPSGSLSSSGARRLLPPSCPALYRHQLEAGEEHRTEFDFGHAGHAEVLGVGAPLAVIDAKDWRTKAAQAQRDEAYATGRVPVLRDEYERVQAMAAALRAHRLGSKLFQPGRGRAEQAIFWVDEEFGIWRRAMLDWIPDEPLPIGLLLTDYKTAKAVDPAAMARAMADHGYAQQAAWYLDAAAAAGLPDAVFLLVFQQRTAPYLVSVAQPDPEAIEWGRRLNHKAMGIYARCRDTGHWPDFADGEVLSLSLPRWSVAQLEAAWDRGDFDLD